MFAPPDRATRTRYLVAEMLVVLLVAVLLVVACRIDPQWISRHVTLLNLWPPPDPETWSSRGRGLLVLLSALVVLGLRPALMFVASRWSLARRRSPRRFLRRFHQTVPSAAHRPGSARTQL